MKEKHHAKKKKTNEDMVVRVLCGCGWWIDVPRPNEPKSCWKCNGQVKFSHLGTALVGRRMGFMQYEWQDTTAQRVDA